MNYLIYIEHAAENLQFHIWYRGYCNRFAALPPKERNLSPEWTVEQAEAEALAQSSSAAVKKVSPETAALFKGTDFASGKVSVAELAPNPFHTPPITPVVDRQSFVRTESGWSDDVSTLKSTNKSFFKKAAGAFEGADVKFQPCEFGPRG